MNQEQRIFQEKKLWKFRFPQSGAALLIFLIILILGMSSLLLSQINDRTAFVLEEQAQTTKALIQAKEALLGYAASHYEALNSSGNPFREYGFLPCTDANANTFEEGVEHGNDCVDETPQKDKSSLGRLPWRTLGLPPLRDGTGECLWYAVSGPYKNGSTTKTEMLNEDTNGLFEVSTNPNHVLGSVPPKDRVVAVVIAPGRILAGQQRSTEPGAEVCGGNYTPSNYLEDINVSSFSSTGLSPWISAQGGNLESLNDRIISITREEIWQLIRKRTDFLENMRCLVNIAATCVGNYAQDNSGGSSNESLPWPAPIDLSDYSTNPDLEDNAKTPPQEGFYSDYSNYQDTPSTNAVLGRLPNEVNDSSQVSKSGNGRLLITQCDLGSVSAPLLRQCRDLQRILACDWPNLKSCLSKPVGDPCYSSLEVIACQTACNLSDLGIQSCLSKPVGDPCDSSPEVIACRTACNLFASTSCLSKPVGDPCYSFPEVIACQRDSVETFLKLWRHWKDHLFYAVARAHLPRPGPNSVSCRQAAGNACCLSCTTPNACNKNCVNNPDIDPTTDSCPAVVLFAGERMGSQTDLIQFPGESMALQTRNTPPPFGEIDTKNRGWSYLNNQIWGETNFTVVKKDANFQEPPSTSPDNEDTNDLVSSCVNW